MDVYHKVDITQITSVESFEKFKKQVLFTTDVVLFRGHSNWNWHLLPGLVRFPEINEKEELEKCLCEKGEEIQRGHNLDGKAEYSELWYDLIQCQHLYYKTRLLDWTISLEHALYFALSDETQIKEDACIWVYICPLEEFIHDDTNVSREDGNLIYRIIDHSPFEIDNTYFFNYTFYLDPYSKSKTGERNRMNQYGRFSIRPTELIGLPLEEDRIFNQRLHKIKVSAECKIELTEYLKSIGITKETIYKNYAP